MSVTRYQRGFKMDSAGDSVSEHVIIRRIYLHGGGSEGDFVFKDGNGDVIPPTITTGADDEETIEYPFGDYVLKGFELDALPSGGSIEVLLD